MIRLVTASRLERLEAAASVAREHARQTSSAANEAFGRHMRELYAVTDRAERAEATATEVGTILAHAMAELSVAQQELLLKDIQIRRLREEQAARSMEGRTLTVLLHYGEPHNIYACREDLYADTATHGVPAGAAWVPLGERAASACEWSCAAFIHDATSHGFRRASLPAPKPVGEAA
ncbi:hypothetical protein OHB41_22450 [Streptomyces sp. NBC_01571]|uniref:hypothetical protein n=1 Tax=Streptomyces sp. NBC_01571 TaxID=2975883 RepID=UPI00225A5D9D|nr:hypothetical protein [Streptomyces sp. NBC_01571]MCX4575901.1 hypothetical protein [Streptomyces sp. NBC_01571]